LTNDLNEFKGTGVLGFDPVYRSTPTGKELVSLSLECHSTYQGKLTRVFVPVTCWGDLVGKARGLELRKGSIIFVMGRVSSYQKDDKSWHLGVTGSRLEGLKELREATPLQAPSSQGLSQFTEEDIPF